jgi:hypothetical protein
MAALTRSRDSCERRIGEPNYVESEQARRNIDLRLNDNTVESNERAFTCLGKVYEKPSKTIRPAGNRKRPDPQSAS